MNGYDYSRKWFDYAFENQDTVTGNHAAVYLWNVELNNRMGWVEKFSSPASQAMAASGIKSYNTYKKVFNDLVSWGFLEVVKESKNQFTATIIALSNFDNAIDKALDKALITHQIKQVESTVQSIDTINKQQTTNNKPQTTNTFADSGIGEGELVEDVKPKRSGKTKAAPLEPITKENLPFQSNKFFEVWKDWEKFRKDKRRPLTEISAKKQLDLLADYEEDTAIEIINKSIIAGWDGLFRPSYFSQKSKAVTGQTPEKGKIQSTVENTLSAVERVKLKRSQNQ